MPKSDAPSEPRGSKATSPGAGRATHGADSKAKVTARAVSDRGVDGAEPLVPEPTDFMDRGRDRDKWASSDRSDAHLEERSLLLEPGDPTIDRDTLLTMSSLFAARHLMVRLARERRELTREVAVRRAAEFLSELGREDLVRKVLLDMETMPIVDVYPLEVMAHLMIAHPDVLPDFEFGDVILNKADLGRRRFGVGEAVELRVPLAAKVRAFALEGGGTPGYCLSPGPPAAYFLEFDSPGEFSVLVRAQLRKKNLVDRALLTVLE